MSETMMWQMDTTNRMQRCGQTSMAVTKEKAVIAFVAWNTNIIFSSSNLWVLRFVIHDLQETNRSQLILCLHFFFKLESLDPCPSTTAHLSERCPVQNVPMRTPVKKMEVETGTFHALPHTRSHCVMKEKSRRQKCIESVPQFILFICPAERSLPLWQ